jgi:nucleoside-diphosphate-sugar epimerase
VRDEIVESGTPPPSFASHEKEGRKMSSESEAAPGTGKLVCVTGASGYIASWLVRLLLARGYTVRATIRDTSDPKKTLHLRALDGANERLHLFEANLLEEGSFDAAVNGCDCVFHTASPFYHNVKDPKAELLDPAVKGTLNVLGSCKKASIRRVIVTSSMAAVAYNGKPRTPDVVVDETWFSVPEICEKHQQWYVLSKTLAEEAAWKFSKDNGFEIVTVNPAMVIGPLLQPSLNTSAEAILKLINGSSSTYPNFSFGWINVKDVALAHILAYEVPSANGRYCMVERVAHYSELVQIIREMYPNIPLPDKCADDKPSVPIYQVSKEKIKSLGLELTPLHTSIKETIESLKEKGFVTFDSSNL